MSVLISSRFAFCFDQPTSALLQFEAASLPEQEIIDTATSITATQHLARVAAQDNIGERIWLEGKGRMEVQYEANIRVKRQLHDLSTLASLPPHMLPGETVKFLLDSRYCRADQYQSLASAEFEGTSGGARIAAIRDWIEANFTYTPGISDASTDASDSFIARAGICRDYTHVLVMLARASSIPARYVACYAPGVTPQDFHAVAEVFLADPHGEESEGAGSWQLVDATGMADLANAVKIGVGRDAADVSFLTTFGPMQFEYSKVSVAFGD
ncbi:transglutaminase [Erythrobacter sp. KY5]|uniref:transglutaminase-like domain-containing protein n=1 Tax=Erythrobacter sp. KY5 TaxID=2011159 RepID=UPI000DBEFAD6|nr:transglutaminase family protein [Erythrobacter sp. KY5]AWW73821.1 transglutaminase [Erythrobacter sp. KY5]